MTQAQAATTLNQRSHSPEYGEGLSPQLLAILAFLLPFEAIGFLYGIYVVSVPAIAGAVAALYLALATPKKRAPLLFFATLMTWFVATVAFRHSPSTYLFSMIALTAFVMPLLSSVSYRNGLQCVINGFRGGFWVTVFVASFEIIAQIFAPGTSGYFQAEFLQHTRTQEFLGFTRVKGLMMEPAHLAIYLCAAYVVFDQLETKERSHSIAKAVATGLMFFTLSLSGVLILLSYIIVKWCKGALAVVVRARVFSVRGALRSVAMLAVLTLIVSAYWESVSGAMELNISRALASVQAVQAADYVGSVGSRANALPVMTEYWKEANLVGVIAGTGYANYEEWLIERYSYLGELSSFARGQLNSMIAAVGVSTGLVGLVLFLLFIASVVTRPFAGRRLEIWAFLVSLQLSFGYLVGPLFWHVLMVLVATAGLRRTSKKMIRPEQHRGYESIGAATSA